MKLQTFLIVLSVCYTSSSVIESGNYLDPNKLIYQNKIDPIPYPPNSTVCYELEGCFSNAFPFNNSGNFLPTVPEIIQTEFILFNHKTLDQEELLSYWDFENIRNSSFDSDLPLKILIHGFSNNRDTPWVKTLRAEILKADKVNVLIVDWGKGALFPNYPNASSNTRLSGKQTGLLVNAIRNVFFKENPRKLIIHCIGHSLGAHTCAYASNAASIRFNRISALDPAGPNFEDLNEIVRVDPTDADFVDVIHSNGNKLGLLSASFGIEQSCGHVDFYVNGGAFQPGCPGLGSVISGAISGSIDPTKEAGCSHNRAIELFIESISSSCPFLAFNCPSQAIFDRGECISCSEKKCSVIGYHSADYKGRGTMYINTSPNKPYCGYHHLFEININSNSKKTAGDLVLILNSDSSNPVKLTSGEDIKPNTNIRKIFVTNQDLIFVDSVELSFNKKSTLFGLFPNPDTFNFDKIKLTNLEVDESFSYCSTNTEIKTGTKVLFDLNEDDC